MKPMREEGGGQIPDTKNSIYMSDRFLDRGTRDESVETGHGRTGNVKAIARRVFLRGR